MILSRKCWSSISDGCLQLPPSEDWSRLRQRTRAAFARTVGARLSQFDIQRYQGLCICEGVGQYNCAQLILCSFHLKSSSKKAFTDTQSHQDLLAIGGSNRLRRNCRWCGRFRALPFSSSSRVLCPGLTLLVQCYLSGFHEVWWLSWSAYTERLATIPVLHVYKCTVNQSLTFSRVVQLKLQEWMHVPSKAAEMTSGSQCQNIAVCLHCFSIAKRWVRVT